MKDNQTSVIVVVELVTTRIVANIRKLMLMQVIMGHGRDSVSKKSRKPSITTVAQENSKFSSDNVSKKSVKTVTMQEDVNQNVVQISVTDSCAKKDAIREESSSVLIDSAFVPKISGDCVQVVDKEYTVKDSKIKNIHYVTEPTEILYLLHLLGQIIMVI